MDNIIAKCQEAQQTVDAYYNVAKEQVSKLVLVDGKVAAFGPREDILKEGKSN